MKLLSFCDKDGQPRFGVLTADGVRIVDLSGKAASLRAFLAGPDWQAQARKAGAQDSRFALSEVDLLPVIPDPDKILCVGVNYASHLKETGRALPEKPMIFTRFAQSQAGHEAALLRPAVSERFDFEGELAVVIGRPTRYASLEDAPRAVAGYSCYNDGSIRDWQRHSGQFTPGKTFPATGGFGPWMVTPDEFGPVAGQSIVTRLNGKVMQDGRLDDLIFDVAALVSYCSYFCTLVPGDVLITGTTGGVGAFRDPPVWMKPGDTVEVEIDGIGVLRNPVRQDDAAPASAALWT